MAGRRASRAACSRTTTCARTASGRSRRRTTIPQFDGPYEEGWTNWGGGDLPVVPKHFDTDTAGIPIPPATGAAPKTKATLAALQTRVDALNDEDRIRNLQSAYGFYEDRKMWDDVVDLFAQDGVVEIGGPGHLARAGGRSPLAREHRPGRPHARPAQRSRAERRDRDDLAGRQRSVRARHRARHARRSGPGERLVGSRDVPQPVREGRRRLEDPRDAPLRADEDRHLPGLGQEPDRRSGAGRSQRAGCAGPTADAAAPGLAMPAFLGVHPVTGKTVKAAGSAKMVATQAR